MASLAAACLAGECRHTNLTALSAVKLQSPVKHTLVKTLPKLLFLRAGDLSRLIRAKLQQIVDKPILSSPSCDYNVSHRLNLPASRLFKKQNKASGHLCAGSYFNAFGGQRLQPMDTGVADVNTDSTQQTVIWECRVATIVVAIAIL